MPKGVFPHPPLVERFWAKVDRSSLDGCWMWRGGASANGYGSYAPIRGHSTGAHRVAYELTYGPIPTGLMACHRCDKPLCVRPDHLFLGTHKENMRDMVIKGRQATGDRIKVPRGEKNHKTKLSQDKVKAIRQEHTCGESLRTLALLYGVSTNQIWRVVHFLDWKWVA